MKSGLIIRWDGTPLDIGRQGPCSCCRMIHVAGQEGEGELQGDVGRVYVDTVFTRAVAAHATALEVRAAEVRTQLEPKSFNLRSVGSSMEAIEEAVRLAREKA